MSRYIEADEVRKRLFSYYNCINENATKDSYRGDTLMDYEVAQMIEDCIEETPTADVQKVIHGVWNGTQYETISRYRRRIRNTLFKCSVCGGSNGRKKTPYCGRCGAKMDGDDV